MLFNLRHRERNHIKEKTEDKENKGEGGYRKEENENEMEEKK